MSLFSLHEVLSSETKTRRSQGAAGICCSTLERLKVFSCLSEPSDFQDKSCGASSKACGHEASDPVQHGITNRLQQAEEEECEDEEEDVKQVCSKEALLPFERFKLLLFFSSCRVFLFLSLPSQEEKQKKEEGERLQRRLLHPLTLSPPPGVQRARTLLWNSR